MNSKGIAFVPSTFNIFLFTFFYLNYLFVPQVLHYSYCKVTCQHFSLQQRSLQTTVPSAKYCNINRNGKLEQVPLKGALHLIIHFQNGSFSDENP